MFRQCMVYDKENLCYFGGIAYYEVDENDSETLQYVICGCCGAIFGTDDLDEDGDFQLVKVYADWVDLSAEICGDDLVNDEKENEN